ncbi:MAG: helix-turn-helix transcriptional regulator [Dehalococcoidales bacterium]|nr:helix-turn-helix transcriptional regulator [Dehalococcoidales bacterium]
MPLPEDNGLQGDGRPKVRRFRSRLLDLGQRLRQFRREHGLTQTIIARVVGVGSDATVSQWETGNRVPNGLPRERLVELLEGRLWHVLREVVVEGQGLPGRWH